MRARREMLFKETMTLNQDVHLRQGRTYSKKFNKQFNENDKEEGTTFQHLQNFQMAKEHAAQELDKNRYGKEAYTILSSQRTQNEKDKMRHTHTQLSRPLETAVTRAQTAENAGLISKIHRMRVANTQQTQDETLAEIVRRKHIETNRLKTIQVQRINQRSFRSVNHHSIAQNHMNQTWFSQRSFRDQDLRGVEQTVTKNYVTLKQSKIQQSEPRAISLDQDEKFRLSKSAQRFNKASFMNINDCDTPKAISTIDTQIMRKEGLSSHKTVREDDGLGDKAEQLSNSTAKYKTKSTGPRSSARSNVELAKQETNATERNSKEKKKAWYTVQPEEFNVEVEEPKYYFQKELITELPLYQPDTQIQSKHSDKNIFKSADFWLSQGHQKSQKKGQNPDPDRHSVALDYYLSGVKIDPQHYGCIYNTGCCHFFTGKFMNALKWFNLCIKVNPYCPDGYYGKSISCLKLGVQDSVNYYEEALQAIEKIDLSNKKVVIVESSSKGRQSHQTEPEMQESTNFSKNQIIFVHAMLCKILGFAEKSKKLYNGLNEQIHADQCVRMKKQIFSVVLISLQKERRITENTLNEFCEEVTLYNPQDCYDEQFTKNLKKLQVDISKAAQKKYLPRFLNKLPLFQRLKVSSLEKNYLSKMTIIEKKKGEQIVLPNNQTVQIVLNGKIVLREHNIEKPSKFDIVQIVKQGQVIGDPELDQGKSLLPFVWAVVQSQQLQLVQMDLADFRMMWQETRQRELEVSMSFLNMNDFFKQLSKQTLYNIIYEKCIRVKYSPGQLVMPIHSRSPWNIKTFKMYQAAQEQNFESDQNKMNVTQNQLIQEKKAQQADFQKHVEQNQKKKEQEMNLNSKNSQNTQNTPRESKIRPIISQDKFSQFSNLMNSSSSKSSRYIERKKTRFLQQKQSKASDEFLIVDSDIDTEDEDSEKSAFRPIMIIRQGNAELKNTKKKYLQEEWERTKTLRRGIDQNRSNIKSQVMIEREQEKEILITRLSTGTVFGESDCLQIIGYEFLGDIYAGKGGLECLVIQQPDLVLAEYERQLLKNALCYQHTTLIQMSETQNNLLGMNPLKEF